MVLLPTLLALVLLTPLLSRPAGAATLATSDPVAFATFVAGTTRIGFDFLPDGVTPIQGNAVSPGSPISSGALIGHQYGGRGVLFSSTAGAPAVAVDFPSDAVSPPNILAGNPGTGFLDYFQPITVTFVDSGKLAAARNDPTGSIIRLEAFDAAHTLLESVQANEGQYLGISRSTADIASATFSWVQNQSQQGFTIDDVYVPEPKPAQLAATAAAILTLLVARSARTKAARDQNPSCCSG
jgi:hypothetical protein